MKKSRSIPREDVTPALAANFKNDAIGDLFGNAIFGDGLDPGNHAN